MELSKHKIVKISNKLVRNRYPRLYGKNSRLPEHSYGCSIRIVELTTDTGISAWGCGHCNENAKAILIGKTISELFNPAIGVTDHNAMGIDVALHDLAGKILNIPISKMLNPNAIEKVKCYDGAIYMNDISPDSRPGGMEAIINDCHYDYDVLGYTAFKVKVGRGGMWMDPKEGLQRDIDVIRLIRKEFPDSEIMIDANDKFTLETTIKFMDAVKDCGIYWIEEPFAENMDDFKRLREYLAKESPKTLIADGEFEWNIELLIELAKNKLIDVLLMDTLGYGFTKWREFMPIVKELGVMASPHNWGDKLKTHYSAHLAAAFSDIVPTIEGVPDTTEGVDFDCYELKNGLITVPDKPGFGMDLIWAHNI